MNIQIDDAIRAAWFVRQAACQRVRDYLDVRKSKFKFERKFGASRLQLARVYGQTFLRLRSAIRSELRTLRRLEEDL